MRTSIPPFIIGVEPRMACAEGGTPVPRRQCLRQKGKSFAAAQQLVAQLSRREGAHTQRSMTLTRCNSVRDSTADDVWYNIAKETGASPWPREPQPS